ncbi:AP2/B3-like transcriptional factor family protein [Euphorbia peplus]|nr:AP2/B3-like transcriptional factor family protein [Euphorbia peplus]
MEFIDFLFLSDQSNKKLPFRSSSKPLERKRKYEENENQLEVSTELTLSYKIHKPWPPAKNGSIDTATSLVCKEDPVDGSCVFSEIKKEPQEVVGGTSEISTELTLSCFKPKITSYYDHHHKIMSDREEKPSVRVRVSSPSAKSCVFDVELISVFAPSTALGYQDVWKIKKRLTASDLGNNSRLMLQTESVNEHILSLLGKEEAKKVRETEDGIIVRVWDWDCHTEHELVLKRWKSSKSYVFTSGWVPKFVNRRGLKKGDTVGLFWDVSRSRFNFSLLRRA